MASEHLLMRPEVSRVILTGGTETAFRILAQRPELQLLAETGGKNATIVSGLSDRDLAIKNILHSAFSHAGQKCSATSLLLLEEEIFESREFKEQLWCEQACRRIQRLETSRATLPISVCLRSSERMHSIRCG